MANTTISDDIDHLKLIPCCVVETPEECANIITNKFRFNVLSLNIRSISKNLDSLLVFLKRLNFLPDILILSECWLTDSLVIDQIAGYTSFCTKNNINQNGGVVAYIKSCWSASVSELQLHEACGLLIDIPNQALILGVYRSPSFRNTNNFICSLDKILRSHKVRKCIILAGDINIDILAAGSSDYQCLLTEHGLQSAITKPTRLNSCLDHIFVKTDCSTTSAVCTSVITDHKITLLGMAHKNKNIRQSRVRSVIDYESVTEELSGANWKELTSKADVDSAADFLTTTIDNAVSKHTKIVKIARSKFGLHPWITPGLLRCARHRDRLHVKSRANPHDSTLKTTYLRYRNFYYDLIKKLKRQYESNQLLSNKNDLKHLWSSIKTICNMKSKSNPPLDLINLTNDPTESLNLVNEYFTNVGNNLAKNILTRINESEKSLVTKIKGKNQPMNSLFLSPTNQHEILTIINNLKSECAPGIDCINTRLLKHSRHHISNPLTHVFNLSLASGRFPALWKLSSVTPIHKAGSKQSPENYRPISLLSLLSKILEKIVNKRLVNFIEEFGLLSPRQFGFRQNRSTEDAVALLIKLISANLDKGNSCIGVFLDLAKAFDSVSPLILIKKLENSGVRGTALNWFKSYLTNRSQLVKIGPASSNQLPIYYGVPQGSILGPTLFIIYMNDIHNLNIPNAEIICYADDTVVLFNAKDWAKSFEHAEVGMSIISNWLANNLLSLNHSKTKFVCFHKTSASKPPAHKNISVQTSDSFSRDNYQINNIERTDVIKYLGIMVDQNCNFKSHILFLSKRIRKTSGIFKKLRDAASYDLLKYIYIAICQPLITYCISVWGSASKTTMLDAERAQRSVLKTMLKKPFLYPTHDLYKEAKVLTIRQLFILRLTLSMHKNLIGTDTHKAMLNRRVYKLPLPIIQTSFARKFGTFLMTHTYNAVVKHCDIKHLSVRQAKQKLGIWLSSLDYISTESLLE